MNMYSNWGHLREIFLTLQNPSSSLANSTSSIQPSFQLTLKLELKYSVCTGPVRTVRLKGLKAKFLASLNSKYLNLSSHCEKISPCQFSANSSFFHDLNLYHGFY